jgi:ribonuclease BN (tRNA processing enzyme)
LKAEGVDIMTEETAEVELVYTGDTTFEGLCRPELDFVFKAEILIMEVTYLDGDEQKAVGRFLLTSACYHSISFLC